MSARILVLDIETAPALGWVWSKWKQDIHDQRIARLDRMLCFAYKWHGDRGTQFSTEFNPDFQDYTWWGNYDQAKHDEMVREAHALLEEADGLVTYNGDTFDIPWLYREFAELKLPEPAPFVSIDLYKVAKRFRYFSRKLDHVAARNGLRGKADDGGMDTWLGCLAGDPKMWRKFERYARRDVALTDDLLVEMQGYLKRFPNANLFRDEGDERPCCPNPICASTKLQRRGFKVTSTGRYPRYQCQDCGKWSSTGKRDMGVDIRGVS